jgi:ribosomal peptide maturation radical SAM protein 1
MDMDRLPFPDFDDYFSTYKSSTLQNKLNPSMVIETSRGCWWGEKFQCTFCGLNGSTMKYRSKSIPRVLDELEFLAERHMKTEFSVIDNILDLKYIEKLFPEISRTGLNVNLFYETKSNLSRRQLQIMKLGGVVAIQPGIESLSDKVLEIMKKGVTALQNIYLLKLCAELRIEPFWNLIWGFPQEPIEEYEKMAKLIPLLVHLHPPEAFGRISLDRFSPYFNEPMEYGITNIKPSASYKSVYPFPEEELKNIAYHFSFDYSDGRDPTSYTKSLYQELTNWRKMWNEGQPPTLTMVRLDDKTIIFDTRPCSSQKYHIFSNEEAQIFETCETAQTFHTIRSKLQRYHSSITEVQLGDFLRLVSDNRLIISDQDRYFSLAVPTEKLDAKFSQMVGNKISE